MAQKLLLNLPEIAEKISKDPIVIVDGGARGEISSPFEKVNQNLLYFIKFEPDPDAPVSKDDKGIILNEGIWNEKGNVKFHLARTRSVSSVLPPDERLIEQVFIRENRINQRKIEEVIDVPVTTLDKLVSENTIPHIDFIKLDIHGSEYEAIEGAAHQMNNQVLGVLAETWVIPIHKGQKTHAQFESLLNAHEFYLLDQIKSGAPKRNVAHSNFHRHSMLKYDSLYFKDVIDHDSIEINETKALKMIGLADLFQHYGYAMQLLEYFYVRKGMISQELYSIMSGTLLKKKSFKVKYFQKIIDLLQRDICSFN